MSIFMNLNMGYLGVELDALDPGVHLTETASIQMYTFSPHILLLIPLFDTISVFHELIK